MTFPVGDWVFLGSAGLGRVTGYAGRGPDGKIGPGGTPELYVVETADSVALVPFSRAEPLRPTVDAATAQRMLEQLRSATAPPSPPEPILERGKGIVHSGSPLDHARFLRELYALPLPLAAALASGVAFFEKLVLPEVAHVLGLEGAVLAEEMRKRYPASRDAKEQAALLRFT